MHEVRNRGERMFSVRPRSCVSDKAESQSSSGEVLTITTASAIHQGHWFEPGSRFSISTVDSHHV
jgi:hypothetical protein